MIISAYIKSDYYPFGMTMPGRHYQKSLTAGGSYRFGFNGKEQDGEAWSGSAGNQLDFGARIYDSRLGRWLSLDPLQAKYSDLSPYNGIGNNPIWFVDPDGKYVKISFESQNAYNTFKQIVNEGLEGEFEMVLVKNVAGDVLLKIKPINEGCLENMTKESQAFYKHLSNISNDKETTIDIKIVEDHSDVNVGNYKNQKIDIADIDQYNQGGIGVDREQPVGATKQGKLTHEVVEQYEKAKSGYGNQNTSDGYTSSHATAIKAENEVNGNTRLEEKSNVPAVGKANQYYREKNGTVSEVTVTTNKSTQQVTQVKPTALPRE